MGVNKAALKAPSGMLKICCLALCIVVVVLARVGFNKGEGGYDTADHKWLLITTTAGYTLILSVMIATYLLGSSIPDRMELLFMFTGCILFLASGALTIDRYDNYNSGSPKDTGLALGSLQVIIGILMVLDSLLIAKAVFKK